MEDQLDSGYSTSPTRSSSTNPDIKADWDPVTAAVRGSRRSSWRGVNEWNTGFKQGPFATMTCPAWMIGEIKEQAGPENKGKWDVTDAFPAVAATGAART